MDMAGAEREGCGVAAVAKVQARGQFTIPEAVRKATGVAPGASLLVRATGPDRFEVTVLPTITADEFFAAMALREDATQEDLRRAVVEGIEKRVLPPDLQALAEVAATTERVDTP
jgi:bifunctional DNA-binding transcriptional regulator/antitoxin component of YhaV-PrlF toxin-antitoxin module